MKKRFFTRLTCLTLTTAIVLSFSGFIYADETDGGDVPQIPDVEDIGDVVIPQDQQLERRVIESNVVPDVDFDADEAAEQFIMNKMAGETSVTYKKYDFTELLEGYDQTAFNYIAPIISYIAEGTQSDTKITLPREDALFYFTSADLGVNTLEGVDASTDMALFNKAVSKLPFNTAKISSALLGSCPYELYWYDKTVGMEFSCSPMIIDYHGTLLYILTDFTFGFAVAKAYQDGGLFKVNTAYGTNARAAASNAKSIIVSYSGFDDYERLLKYNNKICELTDYDMNAANHNVAYGDPWQLVYVFDNNPNTKVVCEGYSKAFQYLCDNTKFKSSELYVLSVSGKLDNENHMWNIVHMDDDQNYIVDITNSDANAQGNDYSLLFMIGAQSGSVSEGYACKHQLVYKYTDKMINLYGDSDESPLKITSNEGFDPYQKHKITYKCTGGGFAYPNYQEATPGTYVSITYRIDDGIIIDHIILNGKKSYGLSFYMPAKDVDLEIVFRKIDYSVSLNETTNGSATVTKTTANYGDEITVNTTPDYGYEVDQIKVNGKSINGNKFTMPPEDVTVEVTFKLKQYKIEVTYGVGGTAWANMSTGTAFDSYHLYFSFDKGYTLSYIKINGQNMKINWGGFNYFEFFVNDHDNYVEVGFQKINYTVTVNESINGSATVSKPTANFDDEVVVTANPNVGYEVDQIKVNGEPISGNTFIMPYENVTVDVTFKPVLCKITVSYTEGGTAWADKTAGYINDGYYVYYSCDKGYELSYIKINGQNMNINWSGIIVPPFLFDGEDANVEVGFKKIDYSITVNQTEGGSLTVSSSTANFNDKVTVTATPAAGYKLDQITVNDDVLNGNSFTMPDGNVTVFATFKKIDYKVSINAGKNGKATVSAATANYGDKITVTSVPDKGYEVDSITVNGNAIKGNTFSMPAKDVTVKVTFKKTVAKVTLTLDKTSAKIVCGSTQTLKATLKNSSSKISWKSSDSKIASVDSNGKITAKQAGKVTITASAAGVSAACTVQVLFKDVVNEKDFWFTPTYYLVNKGVVKGYDNQTLFKPTNDCSRAQMITFLWRLQGEPAPKSSTNKFKDVKSSDYFYKASIWAVEQGITTVPSDKKFNPLGICTRAQTVTFLWRMAGKPEPKKGINKFSDIKSSDYFYKATLWANEMKIVSGYDDGTFKPQGNCTRRQMVTFLYKYDKYVNGKG